MKFKPELPHTILNNFHLELFLKLIHFTQVILASTKSDQNRVHSTSQTITRVV